MTVQFQIVVSSENTQYLAWQTQLFCFSSMTRLGQRPLVVVHQTNKPLRAEFCLLKNLGFRVIEAPSYRRHPKGLYAPRNELGSLQTVSTIDVGKSHILFCEPDMLFVNPIEYRYGIAAEYYSYLQYEEPRVQTVARRFGLGNKIDTLNRSSRFGVPYLIPVSYLARISSRWIEVLDSFETVEWIDIMHAFGIALALEQLEAETTHIMDHNFAQSKRLSKSLIHYCYGDAIWSKRSFIDHSPFDQAGHAIPSGCPGSILHEISAQIGHAREFFRDVNVTDQGRKATPSDSLLCQLKSAIHRTLGKNA